MLLLAAGVGFDLPRGVLSARELRREHVVAGADADLDLPVHRTVRVRDACAAHRDALVEDHRAGLVHLDGDARDTDGERLEVADDLGALLGVDVCNLAQVTRVGVDRLAVALEAHRAEAHVAEDLRRAGELVGRPELTVRLLDLLPFRILEQRHARVEVLSRLIADRRRGCGRRRLLLGSREARSGEHDRRREHGDATTDPSHRRTDYRGVRTTCKARMPACGSPAAIGRRQSRPVPPRPRPCSSGGSSRSRQAVRRGSPRAPLCARAS